MFTLAVGGQPTAAPPHLLSTLLQLQQATEEPAETQYKLKLF